jgi:hypothetical protein
MIADFRCKTNVFLIGRIGDNFRQLVPIFNCVSFLSTTSIRVYKGGPLNIYHFQMTIEKVHWVVKQKIAGFP